ncbi:MAG: BolA family transcriptional regulator [Proteobacteria bacterium]|jgi:BolA family transcriptional regulator, general stress-responsive regulator|nr:BolA family transcriptional regulator [Pseudomonadota bacterium]
MTDRIKKITERLHAALAIKDLIIEDQSHLHAGHAGAKDGRGHFKLTISADEFSEISQVRCHQLVYQAVGDMMQTDIHALAIKSSAPDKT